MLAFFNTSTSIPFWAMGPDRGPASLAAAYGLETWGAPYAVEGTGETAILTRDILFGLCAPASAVQCHVTSTIHNPNPARPHQFHEVQLRIDQRAEKGTQ